MRVYGGGRRRAGVVFEIAPADFDPTWMERIDAEAGEAPESSPAPKKRGRPKSGAQQKEPETFSELTKIEGARAGMPY